MSGSPAPAPQQCPYPNDETKYSLVTTHTFDPLLDEEEKMPVENLQRAAEDLEVVIAATDGPANPNPGLGE
jgi:hypothetical protein